VSELETTKTEVTRVMTRAYPPLIMSLEDVAAVSGLSYNYVKNEVQHEPDFPTKLDRFKSPKWARDDILKWAGVVA
jgi:hypothetical protein